MHLKYFSLATLFPLIFTLTAPILAAPPLPIRESEYSEFEKLWINQTNWVPQVQQDEFNQQTSGVAAAEAPAIEAFWIGTPQWMSGVNNSFEAFGGSMAKGIDFYGSNIQPNQYIPVEIKFDTVTANWTLCQTFRRYGYNSAGVGTFPGSAWDISDSLNPRRLNLCFVEFDSIPAPDFKWNPGNNAVGKYEFLFIMNSSYDGTGATYSGYNILNDDPDVLYAWWPRVADGRTFFETPTASLIIKTFIGLSVAAYENEAILDWSNPGNPPANFKLYWGNTNPPTNLLATLAPTSRGYLHTNLTKNLNYYYQIKSYNASSVEINNSIVKVGTTTERANQMNVVGHWDGRGNNYGACWGWTNPLTGREYGLICIRMGTAGVSIIDLDTIPQVEVGFIPGASSNADVKEVRVWDHYAVVISEGASTKIVDIGDPYHPIVLSTITGGRHCCMVDSHFVYLSGGSGPGLAIWSIANPAAPQLLDQYNPDYYHDYAIHNNTVAAFRIYGGGIDLLDVTDKTNIQLINTFNYPGSGAHNGAFTENGNYLFVGDEIGSSGNWTRAFNVANPNNVSYVADLIVPGATVVHNCYIKGNYLVISHYSDGVRIWNVANPAIPFEVGYFDTYPIAGAGYEGCWHNYPYFPSGKIVASDMTYGLYTLTSPLLPPDPGCCVGNRGDFNGDGGFSTNVLDLTFAVDRIFRGGAAPACAEEGDINGDGTVCNVLDLTFIVNLIFRGGVQPSACP